MITEQQMLEVFRKAPIFSRLSPESAGLGLIRRCAREVHFPAKSVLFREGENGDCLYLLVSGRVRLYKDNTPLISLSVVGGVEFGGELRLEDEQGHEILEEDHDTAGFLGFAFNAMF